MVLDDAGRLKGWPNASCSPCALFTASKPKHIARVAQYDAREVVTLKVCIMMMIFALEL
jgi:hypothetical protein